MYVCVYVCASWIAKIKKLVVLFVVAVVNLNTHDWKLELKLNMKKKLI